MNIRLTAAAAVFAALAAASTAAAQEVRIRDAVARVAVIPEDRADIAVEIEPGSADLPRLRVTRQGAQVRIDGELGRNPIRDCTPGSGDGRPGEGASVQVRGRGSVNVAEAPLVVIRTPRDVDVSASGAVFGSVGRGARSIELANGGCGVWELANTEGALRLALGGSGAIRAGTSATLDTSVGGSGDVLAGATRNLRAAVGGSGRIVVARVDGPADLAIGGSGAIAVRAGVLPNLKVAIGGSGDATVDGQVGDLDVAIAGSGDVRVAAVTGRTKRAVIGSGQLIVGR